MAAVAARVVVVKGEGMAGAKAGAEREEEKVEARVVAVMAVVTAAAAMVAARVAAMVAAMAAVMAVVTEVGTPVAEMKTWKKRGRRRHWSGGGAGDDPPLVGWDRGERGDGGSGGEEEWYGGKDGDAGASQVARSHERGLRPAWEGPGQIPGSERHLLPGLGDKVTSRDLV